MGIVNASGLPVAAWDWDLRRAEKIRVREGEVRGMLQHVRIAALGVFVVMATVVLLTAPSALAQTGGCNDAFCPPPCDDTNFSGPCEDTENFQFP